MSPLFDSVQPCDTVILRDGYGVYSCVQVEKVEENLIVVFGERFDRATGLEISNPSWRNRHILLPFTTENIDKMRYDVLVRKVWNLNHEFTNFRAWTEDELNAYLELVTKVKERLKGSVK